MHQLQPKAQYSPTQNPHGFLLKEKANQDSKSTSSYSEDYVMVQTQFPSETSLFRHLDYCVSRGFQHKESWLFLFYYFVGGCTCELEVGSPIDSCLIYSG